MRLIAQQGLWTTDHRVDAPPAVAVLEVSGAVLAWTVDDPTGPVQVTFTDVAAADWLWRVLGEDGHVGLVGALADRTPTALELSGVDWAAGALAPLRRLALGHWLRRWWPAGTTDGIADLDAALLDAEIAVLTAAAEAFFAGDTFDSDVAGLLQPHRGALAGWLRDGDPRVAALIESCAEFAEWPDLADAAAPRRQDDYALAAGAAGMGGSGAIASGTASLAWSAVQPGVFDAAEDTVSWSVGSAADGVVTAEIGIAVIGPATGVAVRFDGIDGVLDARGRASLVLPMAESAAWNRDWSAPEIAVAGRPDPGETREVRDRIRAFARARLSAPGADAFLAEILAAEADY